MGAKEQVQGTRKEEQVGWKMEKYCVEDRANNFC